MSRLTLRDVARALRICAGEVERNEPTNAPGWMRYAANIFDDIPNPTVEPARERAKSAGTSQLAAQPVTPGTSRDGGDQLATEPYGTMTITRKKDATASACPTCTSMAYTPHPAIACPECGGGGFTGVNQRCPRCYTGREGKP